MDIFTSRELALGFWSLIGLFLTLYWDKTRPYFLHLLLALLNRYILLPCLGLIILTALLSGLLIKLEFWNFDQYKNVILWVAFVGFYSIFRVARPTKNGDFFKETLVDLVKITTIFEFIVTFYSFNFWVELFLVPLMTMLLLLSNYSEREEKYKVLSSFLNIVIMLVGNIVIAYVLYSLIEDFESFFNKGTLYDFFVPIYLTTGLLPYFYLFKVYADYERKFKILDRILKSSELASYAKRKVLLGFGLRLSYLERWFKYIQYHGASSEKEIDLSIERIKFLFKREKKEMNIDFGCGWPPNKAKNYLEKFSLTTGYYDHLYDGKWCASSEPLRLGESVLSDRITYHLDGDERAVKCLTLVLDINEVSDCENSLIQFNSVIHSLFRSSVSKDRDFGIEWDKIESNTGSEASLSETEVCEIEERFVMLRKRKYASSDSIEISLSFAVDKNSFKYADGL